MKQRRETPQPNTTVRSVTHLHRPRIVRVLLSAAALEGGRCLKCLLSALALLLCGSTANAEECTATLAEFMQLKMGISYAKAVEIIGCEGVEMSRSEMAGFTTTMFTWEGGSLGVNVMLMFQNDKLISRNQFGLR